MAKSRKLAKHLPTLQRRRRFYIDATAGSDSNSGRSPSDTWQTIGKANAGGLRAGDRCLLKRGETWTGTRITAVHGVTYGTYGSGAKPVIDGNDTVDGCAVGSGKGHVRFENIKVIKALDYGFSCLDCFAVTLYHCESDGHGNDGALFMTGARNCKVQGGTYQNAYQRIAGPTVTGIEVADGAHDITIDGPTCAGNAGAGISIHSHVDTSMPYNVTVSGAVCTHNNEYGIYILKQDPTVDADRNIRLVNCETYDNNEVTGLGAGIRLTTSSAALNGISITSCRSYNNKDRPVYIKAHHVTCSRCVFADGASSQCNDASDVAFYNCVFYQASKTPFDVRGVTDGVVCRNCIFARNEAAEVISIITTTNVDIDYCLYYTTGPITSGFWRWGASWYNWTNWLLNSGMDAHSPSPADPLFTNPTADDYTLNAASPAIDAGVVVEGLIESYLGAGVDIGAYETA
jgi:hypothetical protein